MGVQTFSGSCGFQGEQFKSVCRLTLQGSSSRSSPLTMTGAKRAAGGQGRQQAAEIQGRFPCLTAHCMRSSRRGSQLQRRLLRRIFPHTSPSAAGGPKGLPNFLGEQVTEGMRLRKRKCVWIADATSGGRNRGISAGTSFELSNPMVQDVRASCQADVEVGGVQAQHLLTSHCKDCRDLLWCKICWRQAIWKSRCT